VIFLACSFLVFLQKRNYSSGVSTVEEIKAAIANLTLEERAEVARSLHGWEDDDWDRQMKNDLAAGKLNSLLASVDKDIADGNLRDL